MFNEVPPLGKLKGRVKKLNSSFDISPTPGDGNGVQLSLKAKLQEHVAQLIKEAPRDTPFRVFFQHLHAIAESSRSDYNKAHMCTACDR